VVFPDPDRRDIFETGNLHYCAEMVWDSPLQYTGSNISLIPYGAANASKDFLNDIPSTSKVTLGGMRKWP
jgi:hypothetical protein